MDKKVIFALFLTIILFGFLNFISLNFFGVLFSPVVITGYAVNDTGIVQVMIDRFLDITIYSPENITYNFSKGDVYLIDLNVSAGFTVDQWMYSIYDLFHGSWAVQDVPFSPNSSITAVRYENILSVWAHEAGGGWASENVTFFVEVPNSAPLLGNITDPIFACEGARLNYSFNATDTDEEDLVGDISPKDPFYLSPTSGTVAPRVGNVSFFSVISGILGKGDVGNYTETISVLDPDDEVDSKVVGVEVIEVNNVPSYENIGAQTVWLQGDNSTFYHVFNVSDFEDGDSGGGNLSFNLSWSLDENLFDIDSSTGVMNYTPVVGQEGRVYSLTVCASDNALSSPHPNISECAPFGASSNVVCDNFSLTVTDVNRAPEIINYTPNASTLLWDGLYTGNFEVNVYDPDGTIPDVYWFVDGVERKMTENFSNSSFSYAFACGVNGSHSVEVVTTDGALNDSRGWSIFVNSVACPVESSGGGGGGGGAFCVENWVCDDWDICQNVKRSFDVGAISIEDYAVARDTCLQNKEEDERFCGFQVTKCVDLNGCGRKEPIFEKPFERRFCYFTENPSCRDGITNCHDGACELLKDCGGPCSPCATCSDRKQNQGEEGVDCGGPCPFLCEAEVPYAGVKTVLTWLAVVLVVLILWLVWLIFGIWRRRKRDRETFGKG